MSAKSSKRSMSALVALALALVACGSVTPGSSDDGGADQPQSSSTALPKEDVTLTVWDQEVRGGQNAQIEQLNKEFMDEYPNVTIKRVAKSFTDINKTQKPSEDELSHYDAALVCLHHIRRVVIGGGEFQRLVDMR